MFSCKAGAYSYVKLFPSRAGSWPWPQDYAGKACQVPGTKIPQHVPSITLLLYRVKNLES
jgi:hypothetical protein